MTIVITAIFILSIVLPRKLTIIAWFLLFGYIARSFLIIPEFYKAHVYDVCVDINCDAEEYLEKYPYYEAENNKKD